MILTVLPLKIPNEQEISNPDLFARNTQMFMAEQSNLPSTDNNRMDGSILHYLGRKHNNETLSRSKYDEKLSLKFQGNCGKLMAEHKGIKSDDILAYSDEWFENFKEKETLSEYLTRRVTKDPVPQDN